MSDSNTLKPQRKTFDSSKRCKDNYKPFIEAHRGFNFEEPENTIRAFQKAIELKLDSVELDVWLSKDLIPVVIHGSETGELKKDSKEKINNLTYEELKIINVGKDQTIPSLEDVLLLCKERIFMNIEIKDFQISLCAKIVIDLVLKTEMHNQVALSSFKLNYYDEILKHPTSIEFGFIYDTTENKKCNFIFDNIIGHTINVWHKEITPEFVNKAHESGLGVHVWFCMGDEEDEEVYKYLFDCGVDIICCNLPHRAIAYRDLLYI